MGDKERNGERTLRRNRHTQATQSPGPQACLQSHLHYSTSPALSEPGVWQEMRFTSILAHPTMTWHLSWPLVQPSEAQRMDLFSLQGPGRESTGARSIVSLKIWWKRVMKGGISKRKERKKMGIPPVWHCEENRQWVSPETYRFGAKDTQARLYTHPSKWFMERMKSSLV